MNVSDFSLPRHRDYLALQAEKATTLEETAQKVEKHSWLNNGHPLGDEGEMDFSLFCNIAADSFMKGTPYEGNNHDRTLGYLHQTYSLLPVGEQNAEITSLLDNAHQISQLLKGDYGKYRNQIDSLTQGKDYVWFPSGWCDVATSAHALILGINTKDHSVTIFNSGAGGKFHQKTLVNTLNPLTGQPVENLTVQTHLKIVNCDPKKLKSPEFYQFLYELQNRYKQNPNLKLNSGHLYKGIEKFLNGRMEQGSDNTVNSKDQRKGQRAGSCSVKGVLSAIHHHLSINSEGETKYKKLKFLLQSRALIAIFKKGFEPNQKYLVQNVIENMARATLKEPLKSALTTEESLQWEMTLIDLQTKLREIHNSPLLDTSPLQLVAKEIVSKPILVATNPMQALNSKGSQFQVDHEIGDLKALAGTQELDFNDLTIAELLVKLKEFTSKNSRGSNEDGIICQLFALIAKKTKEDPTAKFENFSLNLNPLEIFLANPYVVYKDPKTHSTFKKALESLRALGTENEIFDSSEKEILINDETVQIFPTLRFFSQFLVKDNKINHLTGLKDLLSNPQSLPESVQKLYEAYYCCTSFFEGVATPFKPAGHTVSTNPLQYSVLPVEKPQSLAPIPKYFSRPEFTNLIETPRTENQLMSFGQIFFGYQAEYDSVKFSADPRTNKQLQMIGLDKANIPNDIVAFFSSNIELLSQKGMSAYILSQFFRPFALLDQIESQPLFINKLEEFFNNTVDHFLQRGNYSAAFSYLLVALEVEKFLKQAGISIKFADRRKKILEDLLPNSQSTLTTGNRVDILKIFLKEMTTPYATTYREDLALYIFTCHAAECEPDSYLKKQYQAYASEIKLNPQITKKLYQVFKADEKTCLIDYEKATLTNLDGSPFIDQINEIKSHPFYLSYFHNCQVTWTKQNPSLIARMRGKGQTDNSYVLTSGKKSVILKLTPKPHFYKVYEGVQYSYCDRADQEAAITGIPGTLWKKANTTDQLTLIDDKTDQPCLEIHYTIQQDVEPYVKNVTSNHFASRSRVKNNTYLSQIIRLSDSSIFCKADQIDSLSLTNIWVSPKKIINEFSYGPLKFVKKTINGQSLLYCEQHPGYFLTTNGVVDESLKDFITIKNMAGQHKIISKMTSNNLEGHSQLIECDLIDGKLMGGSKLTDKLFLIRYHALSRDRDHEAAFAILKQINCLDRIMDRPKQGQLEDTCFQILLDEFIQKKHPNELALFLHLLKIYLDNKMKYPEKIGSPKLPFRFKEKDIEEVLSAYLQTESNCTYSRLTFKDKLALKELLQHTFPENDLFQSFCQEWQGRIIQYSQPNIEVEKGQPFCVEKIYPIKREGLVFSSEYFDENKGTLLNIARNGSANEKKWLNDVLDCNFVYHKAFSSYTTIYNVFHYPYLPYSINKFKYSHEMAMISTFMSSLINSAKTWYFTEVSSKTYQGEAQPIPLKFDSAAMEMADKSVDTYLKGLLKYFTVKEKTKPLFVDQLSTKHSSKIVQIQLEKENQELDDYRKNVLKAEQEISITAKDLISFKTDLTKTSKELVEKLKTMKTTLLWQINSGKTFVKLGLHSRLKWQDLQKLSLKGDFEEFKKVTTLDENEAEKALRVIGYYLILESRQQQMTNVLTLIQRAEKEGLNSPRGHLLTTQAFETLTIFTSENRNYSQVDRLWFECANKYLYRKNQTEKLKEILEAQYASIQAEMPTGYGKTKAMVPTLNESVSKKGMAVVNCWPATLEKTNIADMNDQSVQSFAKNVNRLTFDRSSNFTAHSLAAIYRGLCEDKKNGRPINCCPESIRALELHFILSLDASKKDDAKIEYFKKILSFFRYEAWATIDEEHVLLSPMDRLIYTIGNDITLPENDVKTIQTLFKILLKEPFKSVIDLKKPQNPVDEKTFRKLSKQIGEKFYTYFKCAEAKQEFLDFVTGKNDQEPKWLANHPKKEQISLVKGMLCFILELSLNAKVDENYGLSIAHADSVEFAISYSSANTPKETESGPSQYKNPHETLIKTYLTYLYKGLSFNQVNHFIIALQEKAELEALQGISYESTEANQLFTSFKLVSPKPLAQLNKEDIVKLYEQLQHHQGFILHYIKAKIVPQIKIYEESISSDAQNFRSQFASSLSLSATPQHTLAHGSQTHFIPMRGTSGQVTHLLLSKCVNQNEIHHLKAKSSLEAADEVKTYLENKPEIKAVIDIGAQTKGLTNLEVAKKLGADPTVKGVLFFDEKEGVFKLFDPESECVLEASEAKMTPEERRTFYDQSRCFGSDIPQACDAVALLLTSAENTKAEVGQALGRMRQIHKGQEFAVSTPVNLSEQTNIQELLVYWIANHSKKEALLNYYSQLQQYDNILRRALLDELIKPEKGVSLLFKFNRDVFITKDVSSPYIQYAQAPKASKTETVLENKKLQTLQRIDSSWLLLSDIKATLKQELNKLTALDIPLPETVDANAGLGMECEVLQEVEVEVELELENQNVFEHNAMERRPIIWDKKLNLFTKGWEGSGNLYPLFKKTLSYLIALPGTFLDQTIIYAKLGFDYSSYTIVPSLIGSVVSTPLAAITSLALTKLLMVSSTYYYYHIALVVAKFSLAVVSGVAVEVAIIAVSIFAVSLITLPISWATKKIGIYLKKNYHFDNFIFRIDEVMQMHLKPNLYTMHQLFSPHFYATNNFYRQNSLELGDGKTTEDKEIEPQSPLQFDQKVVTQVLLIEDTNWFGTKKLKMVAIDKNDSPFFRKKLEEDKKTSEKDASTRTRKVAIYDIANEMIVADGKNAFSLDDLKQCTEFHEMLASAKLLGGHIKYSPEELQYLQTKVDELGKDDVRKFFVNRILNPYKPKNLHCLNIQPIGKILKKNAIKAA